MECVRAILAAQPSLVNVRDLDGRHSTPLHFAAGYNRVPIVEMLLHHGAHVHAKDKGSVDTYAKQAFGFPLYYATIACDFIVVNLEASFLNRGLVPLHNACSYGHYEVTELLVRHGASVNVADLWKFTPLHEAAAKGKYDIVKLLLKVSY